MNSEDQRQDSPPLDIVLSSGFLAFGRHIGFLREVEARALKVNGICGTSSGALVGALWAAGVPTDELIDLFYVRKPVTKLRLSLTPWWGLFNMDPLVGEVAHLLPERLEDLPKPFGVGVCGPGRGHQLLTQGPLIPALLASCAVPGLMTSVNIDGVRFQDGGVVDRVALTPWRVHRGECPTLVHLVERSMGRGDEPETDENTLVVRSPRSHAKLWNLGPFRDQVTESAALTRTALSQWKNLPGNSCSLL
jgi:NTE family protein